MRLSHILLTLNCILASIVQAADPEPDYAKDVAPILRKYCTGCHNQEDKEGGLSLETFAQINAGGKHGPALTAGSVDSSRMIAMMTGKAKPVMPPDGLDVPTEAEIETLKSWVESGAKGPEGAEPSRRTLLVPKLTPAKTSPAITAVAWSSEHTVATGTFQRVNIIPRSGNGQPQPLEIPHGAVNDLEFTADGKQLLVATGVSGLYGQVLLFDTKDWSVVQEFRGHRDTLYAATLSPDGSVLATAGYDRQIILWDVKTGEPLRTLEGHNGAVYDLAFHPDGKLLASASGDETGKIWDVASGRRFDTLSQPEAEQYVIAFHPNGNQVVAAGADNRIRVWRFVSRTKQRINPLLHARFAHEGAVVAMAFSPDGKRLLTASEDRVVKLWETDGYTELQAWEDQADVVQTLAFSPDGRQFVLGLMDGTLSTRTVPTIEPNSQPNAAKIEARLVESAGETKKVTEAEPNNQPGTATPVSVPAEIQGVIEDAGEVDLFRWSAKAGEQWVIETNAARSKSPLDTKIEVLTTIGDPILRTQLQAVRDSYFTFRGKDSNTSDDFRVHNWQEMELDEYFFSNGEVNRLWLYPRGPDSGFKVYPGRGKRYTYFDTPALSHALGEPGYIVRPIPPTEEVVPNGLPVFPIYFENDDDGQRKLGADSKLTFTAPADGDYLVRIQDVRGFGGANYQYKLTIRPRQPDFRVRLVGANPKVNAGSGKEFRVEATRLDDFSGPIQVDIASVPPGFEVTTPLVIEAGQEIAYGVVTAKAEMPDNAETPADTPPAIKVTASAEIHGERITKTVNSLGQLERVDKPSLRLQLLPADPNTSFDPSKPLELTVSPGETIAARVRIERNGVGGPISFGKDDSGRNLPHGAFVDNIGLNGLLIMPEKNERVFFITASPITREGTRTFHLNTGSGGGQASAPAIIHVRRDRSQASVE
ncbi:c-type cytochrome domain-containing protein [Thalassoroseus pseudoceratinae]|uniref:c-type cytochrome domain-containing protein n=1 Tax=Thalassoroseus pseudoceratinae TaxID=2713176 RepID=UPI001420391D|nr:c-type cytochrome domain-containing protein [Thalassoroseus pseudoceratinae]